MKSLWLSLMLCAEVLATPPPAACGPISSALNDCESYINALEEQSNILKESVRQAGAESDAWKKEAVDESPSILPWYIYGGGGLLVGVLLGFVVRGSK